MSSDAWAVGAAGINGRGGRLVTKRTRNPVPTVSGRFATATLVEWIGTQPCRGGECEGDFDRPKYCRRHDLAWDSAQRLLRWQVRRPAVPTPRDRATVSYYCPVCRDTGYPEDTGSFYRVAVGILYPNARPSVTDACVECPRCVVCSVEAALHSDAQEERCARELAEVGPELLPETMRAHHWVPRVAAQDDDR